MNLFLIGYRGSGKTTVAAALAERLGWPWLDADVELERRAGKTIKEIFAEEGERAFRDRESATLADLAKEDGRIIALGGGAVLREENRGAIAGRGKVVWLRASPETLQRRIHADPTTAARRPNLTAQGGLAEIRDLLAQRSPLYTAWADTVVEAEDQSPAEIAGAICRQLALESTATSKANIQ
jgi:shikimate kinase